MTPIMKTIVTTEMHTGGEPVRIIESGYPEIPGETILEKRRYVRENCDELRRLLMFEPRGHKDMYGALLLPGTEGANLDVLFMHNEGYSTMCGHATIALARYAVDKGLVNPVNLPETKVTIGCPCGQVEAFYNKEDNRSRFTSVLAFAVLIDRTINVEGFGDVSVDLAYGGAYYVIVSAQKFGYNLADMNTEKVVALGSKITQSAKSQLIFPENPKSSDLTFIYGTILTDGLDQFSDTPTSNIALFADDAVDRSPCGSGITARIALQVHKGEIQVGEKRVFKNSFTGSEFTGCATEQFDDGVTVEVSGMSYYTGTACFTREESDALGGGFLTP